MVIGNNYSSDSIESMVTICPCRCLPFFMSACMEVLLIILLRVLWTPFKWTLSVNSNYSKGLATGKNCHQSPHWRSRAIGMAYHHNHYWCIFICHRNCCRQNKLRILYTHPNTHTKRHSVYLSKTQAFVYIMLLCECPHSSFLILRLFTWARIYSNMASRQSAIICYQLASLNHTISHRHRYYIHTKEHIKHLCIVRVQIAMRPLQCCSNS